MFLVIIVIMVFFQRMKILDYFWMPWKVSDSLSNTVPSHIQTTVMADDEDS